ncbi:MAG: tetratricopeptide repeat protein [Desulfovibrio sp.]|nr:tetratricopeptide repeat protein [Desulfovibrio sp.]
MSTSAQNCPQASAPMRQKPTVCLMAFGIFILFMVAFVGGAGLPAVSQKAGTAASASDSMAEVGALMAKLKKNPQDVTTLQTLAETFSREQDWERAALFWSKAIDLMPEDVNALNHRAAALARAGNYNEAVLDYEKILRLDPKNYHALYYLGVIHKYGFQNKDRARLYLQQALAMKPQEQEFKKAIEEELAAM